MIACVDIIILCCILLAFVRTREVGEMSFRALSLIFLSPCYDVDTYATATKKARAWIAYDGVTDHDLDVITRLDDNDHIFMMIEVNLKLKMT